MAQRLISSFFTKSDASKNSNTNKSLNIKTEEDVTEESPVKVQKQRVTKQVLESDEEGSGCDDGPEGSMQTKSVANELNKFNSNENTHTNESVKTEVTSEQNNLTNGTSKTKRKKAQVIESDDDDEEIASTKKVKLDEEKETEKEASVFIPKRKTARKGMRSAPIVKIHTSKNSSSSEESDSESSKLCDQDKSSEDNKNDDRILPMEVDVSLANTEDSDSKAEELLNEKDNKTSDGKDCKNLDSSSSDDKDKNIQTCHDKKSEKNAQSSLRKITSKVKSSSKKKDKEEKKIEIDVANEEVSHNSNESSKNGETSEKNNTSSASSLEKSRNVHPYFKKEKSEQSNEESSEIKKNKQSSPGTSYNPSKNKYHPVKDACWKYEEKIPYLALAKTLQLIEDISGRLKMIEILSNFLRSVIVLTPNDFLNCINLCLNRLAPEYEGIKKGVGDDILIRAVAGATAREVKDIKAKVAETGDLGLVAESSRVNQRTLFAPPKLTVSSVFTKFKEIANMSGSESRDKKTDKIKSLLVACRESEARFIVRSLSGKLRIGLAEQSVLAAIARAVVLTPPGQSYPPEELDVSSNMSAEKFATLLSEKTLILKTTYCECSNYDVVIPALLKEGIDELPKHCQLQPGCPLKPMLAHPTNGVDEVLKRFDNNEFTCEFKYDGERAQIHMTEKGEIRIFSRNQEDSTSKYPDVLSRISKALKSTTKSFILDTEAVAWDREAQQILPFQVLSTRKKKDAVESEIVVQVCIMAFDLIYLNGESLVRKTLKERRDLLHSSFVEIPNEFAFVTYRDGNNSEAMQEFLNESVKGNCEGLMVKALTVDASYEIAKRSHNWLKLKKDYLKGVGDTLDLAVIGGYHGKGKRKGAYGGFLLACYDSDNEELQSICKLGTGFSEKDLDTLSETLKTLVIPKPKSYYRYDDTLKPDHWFNAEQIWEIKCADLSISPIHKAALGLVDPEKGISLRFPRFIRIREDKIKMEDATDALEVARMYQSQDQVKNTTNKNQKTDEYY